MHPGPKAAVLVAATLRMYPLPVQAIETSILAINSAAEVSHGQHPFAPALHGRQVKVSLSPAGGVESHTGAAEEAAVAPFMRRELPSEGQPGGGVQDKAHGNEVDLLTVFKHGQPYNDCTNRPSLIAREGNPHAAATIKDHANDPNDPCAKLSQQLTPKILHGHAIVKVPDDSAKAQVPDEEVSKSQDEIYGEDQKSDKPAWMYKTALSLFLLCCLCVLCAIGANRFMAEKTVKRIRRQREQAQAAQEQAQPSGAQAGQPPPQLASAAAAGADGDAFEDF